VGGVEGWGSPVSWGGGGWPWDGWTLDGCVATLHMVVVK